MLWFILGMIIGGGDCRQGYPRVASRGPLGIGDAILSGFMNGYLKKREEQLRKSDA